MSTTKADDSSSSRLRHRHVVNHPSEQDEPTLHYYPPTPPAGQTDAEDHDYHHNDDMKSTPTSSDGLSSPYKTETLRSLVTRQTVLCNIPVLVLVTVASLDNADKQLMASSFVMLERTLHLDVKLLGYFSLFTNLSYALSLPLWGFLVHKYGMANIHTLLSLACCSWGLATVGIAASGSSIALQAVFRALNGVALGSILPLSQTMLVDLVDVSMRGRAFGLMGLCEKLAGTVAATSIVYFESWQNPYYIMGFFSILMAMVAHQCLKPDNRRKSRRRLLLKSVTSEENNVATNATVPNHHHRDGDAAPELTLRQIIMRIAKIPAFVCLVAQGVFGGTPWDMMSFMLLLLDWRGFTKDQIVLIQVAAGASSTLGGWIGGMLGDYANQRFSTKGRIMVAIVSVVGGIPLYGLFLYATEYKWALLWITLFHSWATWTPPAALRPICADLTRNPSERAQIISMWIVLEKASGAIFGAPLVGYVTSSMMLLPTNEGGSEVQDELNSHRHYQASEKAEALAFNLLILSSLFWTICAIFWVLMAYTWKRSGIHNNDGGVSGKESMEITHAVLKKVSMSTV